MYFWWEAAFFGIGVQDKILRYQNQQAAAGAVPSAARQNLKGAAAISIVISAVNGRLLATASAAPAEGA